MMVVRELQMKGPIARRRATGALIVLLLLLSSAGADIIRWQDLYGGFALTQQQCAAIPQAVWVAPKGRTFCIRYYLSTAGGQGNRPVVFIGGDFPFASMADRYQVPPPATHFDDLDTDALVRAADRISKQQQTTAIYFARVGQGGSSGTHHSLRHTVLELLATNAALDAIKRQYGFDGFNVYGHSGGGNLTAGLLLLRDDIGCDVPAEGQLSRPNPHGLRLETGPRADPAHQVFDVTEEAATIVRNQTARILVVTDPEDRIVTPEHQTPLVEKLRAAGRRVEQFFVQSDGPDHHGTAFYAAAAMHDCLRGATHEEIAADLAEITAKRLAAKAAEEQAKADIGRLLDGVNLQGGDYANFQLPSAEPTLCQQACRADAKCAAWTFVKPHLQGDLARCWLKSRAPAQAQSACCTSGVERQR